MNRTLPVLAVAALAITACKKIETAPSQAASSASEAAAQNSSASDAPAQAPELAMAYRVGLILPAPQVRPLMESHQEACERAGPNQCQVLAAEAKAEGKDRASAELTLRATPAWMRLFRTRAEADAKDLGGRVADASTEGDDLSKDIVDTQAAQTARAAERTRLTELMARHTKDLGETLKVEQEITRVQGEMDQTSSELAAMRNRIAMQTVTVSYQSAGMLAPEGVAAPLAEASQGFLANVFAVLAAMVTLFSWLLPFGLVGGPIVWWIARSRRAKAALRPAQPAPPTA